MIIFAERKAGELPKDMTVYVIRAAGFRTTKEAIKYAKENPKKFELDDKLETMEPSGKRFKITESTQVNIEWEEK